MKTRPYRDHERRAAGDGAADRGLRKHADSEHAAAAIPAIAFADQAPRTALSQWRHLNHADRAGPAPRA